MQVRIPYRPLPKQREAHRARERFILYGGAVGGGKSVFIVNDALSYAMSWAGIRVGVYRWELSNFQKSTYPTMRRWLLDVPGLVRSHNRSRHEIELFNGSEIWYGGLKPSSSASGDLMSTIRSLELAAVYVDEASDLQERFFKFLNTRLERSRGTNIATGELETPPARFVVTSNPYLGYLKTRFIDQDLPDHRFVPASVRDNSELPDSYERSIRDMYADSPQEAEALLDGNWDAVVDHEAIIPHRFIRDAALRDVPPTTPVIYGVDVGAGGPDKTVIMRRRGYRADIRMEQRCEPDTMVTADRIMEFADHDGPEVIKIDPIGIGKGVSDRLAQKGYPVEEMVGGASAYDKRFRNRRTELYWELRTILQKGLCSLPNHSVLLNELGATRYSRNPADRTIIAEPKVKVKERLGHSPDYADACAYCFDGSGLEYVSAGVG